MEVDGEEFDPNGPADDGNPFGTAEADITWSVDVEPLPGPEAGGHGGPPQPGHRHRVLPGDARGGLAMSFGTEWYIEPGVEADGPRAGRAFS